MWNGYTTHSLVVDISFLRLKNEKQVKISEFLQKNPSFDQGFESGLSFVYLLYKPVTRAGSPLSDSLVLGHYNYVIFIFLFIHRRLL